MLKKVKMCDIIYLTVRWDCMNNNLLISTAMLNAYWEKERKDTFDLLMPFLKYSIAKTTAKGDKINVEKVTEFFKEEFGYDTIPMNVIPLMLKRLSPNSLSKDAVSKEF